MRMITHLACGWRTLTLRAGAVLVIVWHTEQTTFQVTYCEGCPRSCLIWDAVWVNRAGLRQSSAYEQPQAVIGIPRMKKGWWKIPRSGWHSVSKPEGLYYCIWVHESCSHVEAHWLHNSVWRHIRFFPRSTVVPYNGIRISVSLSFMIVMLRTRILMSSGIWRRVIW
jgi:hypothetical protein